MRRLRKSKNPFTKEEIKFLQKTLRKITGWQKGFLIIDYEGIGSATDCALRVGSRLNKKSRNQAEMLINQALASELWGPAMTEQLLLMPVKNGRFLVGSVGFKNNQEILKKVSQIIACLRVEDFVASKSQGILSGEPDIISLANMTISIQLKEGPYVF